ncbi:MAG TPA: hypothetical protein VFW07_15825 [Parafilimonas sp.]|nr:hypothetical protein [Parafilimonas sp.]
MYPHFFEIAVITDMISLAVFIYVFIYLLFTCKAFCNGKCIQDRTGIVLPPPKLYFSCTWSINKSLHKPCYIMEMNIIPDLLALYP